MVDQLSVWVVIMENGRAGKNKKNSEKSQSGVLSKLILAVLVFVCAISLYWNFGKKFFPKETIITDSYLRETVNISKLSTAKYTHNGIAQIYEDNDKDDVKCSILYHAEVKAGIDMNDISFDIDENKKTIGILLPEIKLTASIADENSLSTIPDNVDLEDDGLTLPEIYKICEEDALEEAGKSIKLQEIAQKNLKDTIEALLLPVIEDSGYSITWL